MPLEKFEGEIVIATATVVGTFAGSAITMPVGNYFLNSIGDGGATRTFLLEFKNQLDTATGRTWTITVDDGTDTSLGKVTISCSGAATTATWTSTTIRDLLGFTANLGSGTTWTGDNHAKYLFLPNCGRSGVLSPQASDGAIEADHTLSISPEGTTYGLAYSKRYRDTLELRTLKGSKVWNSLDVTTNEAFEQFYTNVISLALRVRFHADRSVDATFRTWVVEDAGHFDPMPVREDWTDSASSLWAIRYMVRKSA